jgi:hypothetical protein
VAPVAVVAVAAVQWPVSVAVVCLVVQEKKKHCYLNKESLSLLGEDSQHEMQEVVMPKKDQQPALDLNSVNFN